MVTFLDLPWHSSNDHHFYSCSKNIIAGSFSPTSGWCFFTVGTATGLKIVSPHHHVTVAGNSHMVISTNIKIPRLCLYVCCRASLVSLVFLIALELEETSCVYLQTYNSHVGKRSEAWLELLLNRIKL